MELVIPWLIQLTVVVALLTGFTAGYLYGKR
jgi:hypothetical protein